jgi:aminopeptidase N
MVSLPCPKTFVGMIANTTQFYFCCFSAGPMSHPIRPESYISMDNFYTATGKDINIGMFMVQLTLSSLLCASKVYSKGAEVIRMYQTLLGKDGFRKGMDLYFERHDGNAVTCDDFLAAMADANDVDLSQFARWYSTNGTPTVKYESKYDEAAGIFYLTLSQESNSAEPLHIPVSVGLLDKVTGEEVVATKVLNLKEKEQTFEFSGLKGDVVPSVLREFSAPVKLMQDDAASDDEENWAFLAARDTDGEQIYSWFYFESIDWGILITISSSRI